MKRDEADLLFNGSRTCNAESELIFAMQAAGLSTQEKLQTQRAFRAADNDGKWALLGKFCGPSKGDPVAIRQMLGL